MCEIIRAGHGFASLSSWRAWIEIRSWCQAPWPVWSLSSWRAWIEICMSRMKCRRHLGRSPHGERGLKSSRPYHWRSQPWCRSPHGERGLKLQIACERIINTCRSPHGERGLKCEIFRRANRGFSRSPHGERGLKSAQSAIPFAAG